MSEENVDDFKQWKSELLKARSEMTKIEAREAIADVYDNCQIYDIETDGAPEDGALFEVKNQVAIIPVRGMLVQEVSICAAFFGETMTTYRFIQQAAMEADINPRVDRIAFDFDTPGGSVSGVEETFQVISSLNKPSFAIGRNLVASAGYWLASACDQIISVSKTGFFGSIGVITTIVNSNERDERNGIKRTTLTNRKSRDKNPDELTDEGLNVIADRLDSIYNVFVDSIMFKRGEKVSAEAISNLEGRVLIASEALNYGLVDSIQEAEDVFYNIAFSDLEPGVPRANGINITEENGMITLKDFLEKNPDAAKGHQQAISEAKIEAAEDAVKTERDRVVGILKVSGSEISKTAMTAIEEGKNKGEYAIDEISAVREARKEKGAANGGQKLGALGDKGQLPKGNETSGVSSWDKKVDDALDKYLGKDKEGGGEA